MASICNSLFSVRFAEHLNYVKVEGPLSLNGTLWVYQIVNSIVHSLKFGEYA